MAMWQLITIAPYDVDLEVAVIDQDGAHALIFACQRSISGWVNAKNGAPVEIHPTHWRLWTTAGED
uniref:DUF551 domain-containing protein n=1 Tax=Rhodopseudomonas palustris (strain BisA53) TaxID=316055 RepID=Q07NU2_RHOP5